MFVFIKCRGLLIRNLVKENIRFTLFFTSLSCFRPGVHFHFFGSVLMKVKYCHRVFSHSIRMAPQTETKAGAGFKAGVKDYRLSALR